ncbi:MAG TPA: aldo/keto reductase, partial [Burkholderiales bacterium]|nr:aldo/keto reductase [Burkholderiales bacterium]
MTMANFSADSAATPIQRTIPRSGEALPVVGLGTFIAFDVAPGDPDMPELKEALKVFIAGGGRLIDSSPMYGRAESVVGELAGELTALPSLFLATKVWTSGRDAGIEQMRNS